MRRIFAVAYKFDLSSGKSRKRILMEEKFMLPPLSRSVMLIHEKKLKKFNMLT